jgi:hypothetical protein
MKITKSKLKQILKEELLKEIEQGEKTAMSDLYTDYSEDPIEALQKRRDELESRMRTAKDAEYYMKLTREIVKLKLEREKQQ